MKEHLIIFLHIYFIFDFYLLDLWRGGTSVKDNLKANDLSEG